MRGGWKTWTGGAVVTIAVLAVVVPYVYIHAIEGDPPAKLSASSTQVLPVTGTAAGTWTVTSGSQAGYRVEETLAGQDATAVGRTDEVTGTITVTDTAVTAGTFTVDLTSVSSDQSQRDDQFRGRIMQTDTYPTAVFVMTGTIPLGNLATQAGTEKVTAAGTLTLHGVTKAVTVPLTVVRSGDTVTTAGDIPVHFRDYGIDNPSFGNFVKTGDDGTVEVLLKYVKK